MEGPALTIAVSLSLGVLTQVFAERIKVPGIILLLGVGILLGDEGAGWIRPSTIGDGLPTLVGFAVAIVVFEGGLGLRLSRLRRQAGPIGRLVIRGALVSLVLSALVVNVSLGFDVETAVLFGSLMIVTGPTVVNPLVRRLRLRRALGTVLEAEGIFADVLGAISATIALEFLLKQEGNGLGHGVVAVLLHIGFGALVGGFVGWLLELVALRPGSAIPEKLKNSFVLSIILVLFHGTNHVFEESGIAAVAAAGIVLGNKSGRTSTELFHFKEQITQLLLGMMFILLAASIQLADLISLGPQGLLVALCLVFVVRPVAAFIGTLGSNLNWKERVLVATMGPRGIVAVAMAALVGHRLSEVDHPHAGPLESLIYLTVILSVISAGVLSEVVARGLNLRTRKIDG